MIEIKSLFSDWHQVSIEQAKSYVTYLMENITTMNEDEKKEYIQKNNIRGIKVEELLHSGQ